MLRVRELAFLTAVAMAAMTGASVWQAFVPPVRHAAVAVVATPPKAVPVKAPPLRAAKADPLPTKPAPAAKLADEPARELDEDDPKPESSTLTAAEVEALDAKLDALAPDVAQRVRDQVPVDLMRYFDVVLYVSKAGEGPWSQHMFVFHRAGDGGLVYEKNFPVSTGREQHEKYFTDTPAGIFELDPNRFEPMHYSHTWHGAPMQWSMFLNFELHNRMVGIALHSAGGHAPDLGHRASGGCVRLPPQEADELFHRFEREERGMVPVMAFDNASGTTSRTGETMQTPGGLPLMAEGYKVLLVIEDYPGGPAAIAVLS
ncbi:MAG TPA: L,D-transpeptidase [Rhizomicrobium sp.]|nr:L,D-transpeptidase [Rhizomicrobium sp.]